MEKTEARKKENIKKREGLRKNLAEEIASKEGLIKEHCKEKEEYITNINALKNQLKVEKEGKDNALKLIKVKEEAHNNTKKLLEDEKEAHNNTKKLLEDEKEAHKDDEELWKDLYEDDNRIYESNLKRYKDKEEATNKLLEDEKKARLATIKEKDDKVKLVIEMENKLEKLSGENDILEEKIKSYDMKIKKLKETYKNNIKKNNRYKIEMKKECLQFKETLLAAMDSVPKIFDTQTVNEDLADDDADHFTKSSELEDAECNTSEEGYVTDLRSVSSLLTLTNPLLRRSFFQK